MTAVCCVVVTCRGGRVMVVDDDVFTRRTVEIKPWKIRHVLEELRVAGAGARKAGR